MFSSIRIALILTVISLGGAGLVYVNKLQADLKIARENVAKLETAVAISEASISTMQQDIERNAELNKELQQQLQQAEQYGDELRATLQKHNLTHLANKKPGLIEKRMQNATDQLWDDLANITDPSRVLDDDAGTQDSNSN